MFPKNATKYSSYQIHIRGHACCSMKKFLTTSESRFEYLLRTSHHTTLRVLPPLSN